MKLLIIVILEGGRGGEGGRGREREGGMEGEGEGGRDGGRGREGRREREGVLWWWNHTHTSGPQSVRVCWRA